MEFSYYGRIWAERAVAVSPLARDTRVRIIMVIARASFLHNFDFVVLLASTQETV